MKPWYWILGCFVLTMTACQWGVPHNTPPAINKDTLAYTYQAWKQKANDCSGKSDSGCTIVDIRYPLFKNQPKLNDTIKHRLLALFASEKPDTSIDSLIRHFFAQYYADKAQRNRPDVPYELNMDVRIIRQDSSLTTLRVNGYTYTGGAHGRTITDFINWNTKANKNILLNDILKNGYEKELVRVGDSIFRAQEHLSTNASLKSTYFFKNDVFNLNNNYMLTPTGIHFLYNQYEIKPYAAGQTNLLIPYSKIKSLLLPHTVIAQYIK